MRKLELEEDKNCTLHSWWRQDLKPDPSNSRAQRLNDDPTQCFCKEWAPQFLISTYTRTPGALFYLPLVYNEDSEFRNLEKAQKELFVSAYSMRLQASARKTQDLGGEGFRTRVQKMKAGIIWRCASQSLTCLEVDTCQLRSRLELTTALPSRGLFM